jgi:hypothetical protein
LGFAIRGPGVVVKEGSRLSLEFGFYALKGEGGGKGQVPEKAQQRIRSEKNLDEEILLILFFSFSASLYMKII